MKSTLRISLKSGERIFVNGAVLRVAGVDWVEMIEPAEDIIMDRTQAGNCTGTDVSVAADGVAS